ncbi:MAG TPA: SGNH/GDSL hydrolase family protein [Planctomycetota bacterium]|nr:SGNH/GDSL hydrolase family protein [Planctomycetota bacterium]
MKSLTTVMLSLLAVASAVRAENTFWPLAPANNEFNSENATCMWLRPDLGTAADVLPLKTRCVATKESVTDGVGMKWIFEKGSKGVIAHEVGKWPANHAGVTFYAKASRPIQLTVTRDVRVDTKPVDITTEWKKYDIPFKDCSGNEGWWQFVIKVVSKIDEPVTLWLDRVGTEGPEFIANPKIDPQTGPDETISSKDILYGAENLSKIADNLKNKKPFKILVCGDSISAGAQTMRGTWGIPPDKGVQFRYFGRMASKWEEEFGYKGIELDATGAHGGWTTAQLLNIFDKEVLSKAGPNDLIILQSGGNDVMAGTSIEQIKSDMKKMIAKAKTKTDQIIMVSTCVNGTADGFKWADQMSKLLKDLVAEEKVAGADTTKFMYYRGPKYAAGLLANPYHPDYMGHIIMGEMFAPLLTGKHVTYPW